jgi:hypothetical protein
MAKINVIIDGKEYPIKMTMGALLRFKQDTGKEITDKNLTLSDNINLVYCSLVSACAHDKVGFDMSLMEFADCISMNDVNSVIEALFSDMPKSTGEDDEKK